MINHLLNNPAAQATLIGETVRERLFPGQHGYVLAVVTQAIFLLCEQNELLWLTADTAPMHRRCLQVMGFIPRLSMGSAFFIREHTLVIDPGYELDFGPSEPWSALAPLTGEIIKVSNLPDRVDSIYYEISSRLAPVGMGRLIPAILREIHRQPLGQETGREDVILKTTWPIVRGILTACRSRGTGLLQKYAEDLIGLGEGLTPSGDDFLGGFFFCTQLLRQAYPELPDLVDWYQAKFILNCELRTNLISFTILKDHLEGHTLEPLHRFANALLTGKSKGDLVAIVRELVAVGHSTGWDLLTGFLAGMSVVFSE